MPLYFLTIRDGDRSDEAIRDAYAVFLRLFSRSEILRQTFSYGTLSVTIMIEDPIDMGFFNEFFDPAAGSKTRLTLESLEHEGRTHA